jgi:amino acid adenylation domain-containing protein/non-ribosomal peptide synthase protein (TIGR01720 family)
MKTPETSSTKYTSLDELVRRRSRVSRSLGAISGTPSLEGEREGFPLSFAQERLWFLDQLVPGSPFYSESAALRLKTPINVPAMERSLGELVRRHEVLRTTFIVVNGRAVQVVSPPKSLPLPIVDLRRVPEADRDVTALRHATEEARGTFDLSKGPLVRTTLLRLGEQDYVFLLTMHHIICDGWSLNVFWRDLGAIYSAFCAFRPSPLAELPIQYADFSIWQREQLQGEVLRKQLNYWKERLNNLPVLQLPSDHPRPAVFSYRGDIVYRVFPSSLLAGLKSVSQQEKSTLFMTLLAAFKVLLHRYTGQMDIVIGSPIANRNRVEIEDLIGFFVNTLVMRSDLSGNPTFREFLRRVREMARGAYAHQDLPFEKLVGELHPQRDLSRNPLFQVIFQVGHAPAGAQQTGNTDLPVLEVKRGTAKFDLRLDLWEGGRGLEAKFEYSTDLFEVASIERMADQYQVLLEAIASNPDQRIGYLPLMRAQEVTQVVEDWNRTEREYPRQACVHELFEAEAERHPEAVALVYRDEQQVVRQMRYGELNRKANQVAERLRGVGVGLETLVGLCTERSAEMVVGMLGILKTGGAYVPLDAGYPAQRLAFMMQDAGVKVLLTHRGLLQDISKEGTQVIELGSDWQRFARYSGENCNSGATANNLAYVMYTSGSTGIPKGVAVVHRGIIRLVKNTDYVTLNDQQVFLQLAPVSFDASTFEIWGALLHGAQLVLYPPGKLSLEELGEVLQKHRVTTLWLTAGLFQEVVDNHPDALAGVRQLLAGGDVLPLPQVEKVMQFLPACQLINGYGPTECTTFSSCCLASRSMTVGDSLPIGRPISNTQIYIVDRYGNPSPVGVPGELYIGGDGLARGYWKRPELTADRFVPNQFAVELGARLYRTGDVARFLPEGTIEFLGRIDQQVKIRGFRIELPEIEESLNSHSAVQKAVVLAREDKPNHKRLIAYIVPRANYADANDTESESPAEMLAHWQTLYDHTYAQHDEQGEADFNIVGWNSTYTGKPLPGSEMRSWLDNTVASIKRLKPARVLEIGCGTGLLLSRIAPLCKQYVGTDFSSNALRYVEERILQGGETYPQVKLLKRNADDFAGFDELSFDLVILNSVIQYFPSLGYLTSVLEGATKVVASGGAIFLGDVRSLPLLRAFHTAAELYAAPDSMATVELMQLIRNRISLERELLIDPSFFAAVLHHLLRITKVQVQLKRGKTQNELTQFRYEVVLHIGAGVKPLPERISLDWQDEGLTLDRLKEFLADSMPESIALVRIPNARVLPAVRAVELLERSNPPETVQELRAAIAEVNGSAVDPEAIWILGEQLGYRVDVSWSDRSVGCCEAMLTKADRAGDRDEGPAFVSEVKEARPWTDYANCPLQRTVHQKVIPELQEHLQRKLPDYMMPSAFVLLRSFPLTPNGKVDVAALGTLEVAGPLTAFVAPRNAIEDCLTRIWAQVLGSNRVSINDNFFSLGGDSILCIQIIARARKEGLEFTPKLLFQHQTIAELAKVVSTSAASKDRSESATCEAPLTPVQHWFFEQGFRERHHFNQSTLLEVRAPLNPAWVEIAAQYLIEYHAALRLRFKVRNGQWQQFQTDLGISSPFARVDLTSITELDQRSAIETETARLQTSLNIEDGPLFRCVLFDLGPFRACRLFFVCHHLVIDGVSWRILMEDFWEAYSQLSRGERIQLPQKTTAFLDWSRTLAEYAQSTGIREQINYWMGQAARIQGCLPVDFRKGANTVESVEIVSCALNRNETRALLQDLPRAQQTQINDVLLTALSYALTQWTGLASFWIELEGHGREQVFDGVDVSRTVGWFTSVYPVLLELRNSSTALGPRAIEELKFIKKQLRQIPDRGIGFGLLRYLSTDEDIVSKLRSVPIPELTFNYLGQLGASSSPGAVIIAARESVGPIRSLRNTRKYLLELSASVADGEFRLHWLYSKNFHSRKTIEALAQSYLDALRNLISRGSSEEVASYSASDFPQAKLKQEDLDRIVQQIDKAQGDVTP